MLLEEELTDWTEEELIKCKDKKKFVSFRISRLFDSDFGKKTKRSTIGPPPAATPTSAPSALALFASPLLTPGRSAPAPADISIHLTQPSSTGPTLAAYGTPALYTSGIGPTSPAHIQPPNTGLLPAITVTTTIGHGRKLSNLAKIYTNKAKYSGRNDSFTFKLAIFHDICSRANVPPEAKIKAFSTMLKGLALDYYYSNISTSGTMNFDQVCNSIRNYFERAEYKQSVLSKWNKRTFKSVISKSESKPIEKCLKKLIDKLWHLQHGLDLELCTDHFIHNKLINAYQNIPACQYACLKPADSLAGLINNLRSSIITYIQANPTSEAFFTD